MMRFSKRLFSVFIIFTLLCPTIFSTTPFAVSNKANSNDEVSRVKEIAALRESNSETYLLSDGSYECVVFAEDKYYQNAVGEFLQIDNSIVQTAYSDLGILYRFTNFANQNKAYFSDGDSLGIRLQSPSGSIAFTPLSANSANAISGGLKNTKFVPDFPLSGDNYVAYRNIYDGVDFVYAVENAAVKEYIVLNDISAPLEYEFAFNIPDHTVKTNEYGRIVFVDREGNIEFELTEPFAVDAAGTYTDNVECIISDVSEDSCIIKIAISPNYFNDSRRAFPIIIDPSIMITGELSTYDSYVSSKYPTSNYYMSTYLRTGRDDDYYIRRSYIRFKLPYTIDGDNVTSAYLRIKQNGGATPAIKAYRVTNSWTSNTLTWNNKPGYTTVNSSGNATLASNGWYQAYVTSIVKSWLKGAYRNDGFLLKDTDEYDTTQWTTFYSSDAASPNKPELIINYSAERPLITYNFRLYKNADMITSASALNNYISTANSAFQNTFNVSFNRRWTLSASALNQRSGCTRGNPLLCNSTCGALSRCTDVHHKAGYYFLYVNEYPTEKVFRYVDYALCVTHSGSHSGINGASVSNRNIIVTLQSPNIQRTTCHELSHWIGANDLSCVNDQACVMRYGTNVYNVWCAQCAQAIVKFLG